MSILTVVKDVCMAVGVATPTSMFTASIQPRTQAEMLSLANEMAQRIAYDVREWTMLKATALFTGPGAVDPPPAVQVSRFAMPSNFRRFLLSSQVYSSAAPRQPLQFIPDTNEWLVRRLNNETYGWGEWTIIGGEMHVSPVVRGPVEEVIDPPSPAVPAQALTFAYLDKNCVTLASGGYSDTFAADGDSFRLDERLLKLGMIWQWKANKGSPYAEDMGTYSDALVNIAGTDSPAPIIVGDGRTRWVDARYVQ